MFYYHPLFQNENKKRRISCTHDDEREGIEHKYIFHTHTVTRDTHVECDQRIVEHAVQLAKVRTNGNFFHFPYFSLSNSKNNF